MRTARLITIGIGVVFGLGIGVVTLSRAQQSAEKRVWAPTAKGELRERVLKLRTDIDLAQVDFDVARVKLFEPLKAAGGTGGEINEARAGIRDILEGMKRELVKEGGVEELDLEGKAKVMSETLGNLGLSIPGVDQKLLQDLLAGGQKSKAAADRIEQIVVNQATDESKTEREAIDRHKKDFARVSRKLNEMKLNLAELERQYQREAP